MVLRLGERLITNVVLDYDGVLANPDDLRLPGFDWMEIHASLMQNITPEENTLDNLDRLVSKYRAIARTTGYRRAYVKMGGTREMYDEISNKLDRVGSLKYDEELARLILLLSEHARVSVFTGNNYRPIRDALAVLLGASFRVLGNRIITADGMIHEKPQRRAYAEMLVRYRMWPRSTVMIDDTPNELRSAESVGMNTIWVDLGRDQEPPATPFVIPRLKNLLEVLIPD